MTRAVARSTGVNADVQRPAGVEECWVFGYGSLVWRPDFDFEERVPAILHGWKRRFWQGSTDHRGVPGEPGRVVTLVRAKELAEEGGEEGGEEQSEDAQCSGVAFRLLESEASAIFEALEIREQGGYSLSLEACSLSDGREIDAWVYVALPENENYLGPASLDDIAFQILGSRGPSGENAEYLLELDDELTRLGLQDQHVAGLARRVRAGLPSA